MQSPIGRITLSAFLRHNRGISPHAMRVLGSYAVVLPLGGAGVYRDGNGLVERIVPGRMIVVFPDLPHSYGPAEGEHWDEFFIVFDGPVFDLWRERGLLDPHRPIIELTPLNLWLTRLHAPVAPFSSAEGDALARICLLQRVLAEALSHRQRDALDAADRDWLARAQALLEPRGSNLPDLELVAKRLDMSYAHFRKRFARLAGVSPAKHRFNGLIRRSIEMMHDPRRTLRDIADACGFCNEFHFSRRFKQTTGLSPSEYRRKLP